jgi:uncharacterized protein with HEPN domain
VPSSDPVQRFGDIIENIGRIEGITAGLDLDGFAANEEKILAVKYALLTISEAAVKLGQVAADLCPDIPWREIRGLGNRLRHDYDSIDLVRIWLLIERNLPPLKAACENALRVLERGGPPMLIGYARVPTDEQLLALQIEALPVARTCFRIRDREPVRPGGLADALAGCAAGDVLVAWKVGRLGRTLLDLVGLVEKLKAKG